MTTKIIKDIKADMSKLYTLFQAIMKVFPSDENTLVSVMLQNLQFDGSNCVDYNEADDWKHMNDIKDALHAMKQYYDYHLIGYVVDEVDMSFMANDISEEDIAKENYDLEAEHDRKGIDL